jgi:hypothetical protein
MVSPAMTLSALAEAIAALPTKADFRREFDRLRREIRRDRLAGDPGERRWIAGRWRFARRGC